MRRIPTALLVWLAWTVLIPGIRAEQPDATLRTDYKYAWPREDATSGISPWPVTRGSR